MAMRMAVNPAHSASRVIRFGTSIRIGMRRKRLRLCSIGSGS
jgi:hypothetical protein